MSEITAHSEKKLVLAAGRAHPELAREIAKELGTELLPIDAYDFANGEIYVRAGESVRGTDAFVIQAHPAPLNNHLMEQLIMIDSLKRASAKRITVVSPFYPYARQDKKGRGREPISAPPRREKKRARRGGADFGPPGGGLIQDGRRGPHHER